MKTTRKGHKSMIIAQGLGKINAQTPKLGAFFEPIPRAIIMFL